MQKTKHKTSLSGGNERLIQLFSLLSIFILFLQRFFIINRCDIQGGAYFFSVYHFILLFAILLPLAMPDILEEYIRELVAKEQYNNAMRVMYAGFFIGTLYCVAMTGLVLGGYSLFHEQFLLGKSELLILVFMLIAVTVNTYSGVFLGFLNGLGKHHLKTEHDMLHHLLQLIGVLIFTGAFGSYGNKVADVLSNAALSYSFAAAGAALAYLVSSLVSFVLAVLSFRNNSRKFYRLQQQDDTRKNLDVYDCFQLIAAKVFPYGFSLLLCVSTLFIDQWIFFAERKDGSANGISELTAYQWGCFAGIYVSFLVLLFLLTHSRTLYYKTSFRKYFKSKNMAEIKKINYRLKLFSILDGLTCMVLLLIMAPELTKAAAGHDSAFSVSLLRICAPFLPLISYAFSQLALFLMTRRQKALTIIAAITMGVNLLLNLLLMQIESLGIYTVVISGYLSAALFAGLSVLYFYQYLKLKDSYAKLLVRPLLAAGITAVPSLGLHFLLGLFLPSVAALLLNVLVSLLVMLISLVKLGCLDELTVSSSPFGLVLGRICTLLRLFR